jgi:hypothetical protein
MGGISCAATENALVETQNIAPISNPKDRKIPVCINVFLFRGIARSTAAGPFGNSRDNQAGTHCRAVNA